MRERVREGARLGERDTTVSGARGYGDNGEQVHTGASPTGRRTMVFLSAGVDVADRVIGSLEAGHGTSRSCGWMEHDWDLFACSRNAVEPRPSIAPNAIPGSSKARVRAHLVHVPSLWMAAAPLGGQDVLLSTPGSQRLSLKLRPSLTSALNPDHSGAWPRVRTKNDGSANSILFFLVQTKMSWCILLIIWYSRKPLGIKVQSCATMVPQMTVAADLTQSEDWLSLKPGYAVGD